MLLTKPFGAGDVAVPEAVNGRLGRARDGESEDPSLTLNLEKGQALQNPKPSAQEMALFLQKLPTGSWGEREVETVLSRAYMWRTSFDQAQSHLSQS